jgi:hypothetical protein
MIHYLLSLRRRQLGIEYGKDQSADWFSSKRFDFLQGYVETLSPAFYERKLFIFDHCKIIHVTVPPLLSQINELYKTHYHNKIIPLSNHCQYFAKSKIGSDYLPTSKPFPIFLPMKILFSTEGHA